MYNIYNWSRLLVAIRYSLRRIWLRIMDKIQLNQLQKYKCLFIRLLNVFLHSTLSIPICSKGLNWKRTYKSLKKYHFNKLFDSVLLMLASIISYLHTFEDIICMSTHFQIFIWKYYLSIISILSFWSITFDSCLLCVFITFEIIVKIYMVFKRDIKKCVKIKKNGRSYRIDFPSAAGFTCYREWGDNYYIIVIKENMLSKLADWKCCKLWKILIKLEL